MSEDRLVRPGNGYAAPPLRGIVDADPMPWDLDAAAERAARHGPVRVVVDEPVDAATLFAGLGEGETIILQLPGPDDAHDLCRAFGWRPHAVGPDFGALVAAAGEAGLTVADSGQWRAAYRFVDAEAVLAFLAAAWWLPVPDGATHADLAGAVPELESTSRPIRATQSRMWLRAHRPGS